MSDPQFINQNGDASAVAAGAALDEQRAFVTTNHDHRIAGVEAGLDGHSDRIAMLEVELSGAHERFASLELALARIVNHLDPHGTSASVRGAEEASNA